MLCEPLQEPTSSHSLDELMRSSEVVCQTDSLHERTRRDLLLKRLIKRIEARRLGPDAMIRIPAKAYEFRCQLHTKLKYFSEERLINLMNHLENIRALNLPYTRDISGVKLPTFSDDIDPNLADPNLGPYATVCNIAQTWPDIIEGHRLEYVQRDARFLRVGQGEVGQVYLARFRQDHSALLAVKLLHKSLSMDLVLHEAATATLLNATGATARCHGIVRKR